MFAQWLHCTRPHLKEGKVTPFASSHHCVMNENEGGFTLFETHVIVHPTPALYHELFYNKSFIVSLNTKVISFLSEAIAPYAILVGVWLHLLS